LENYHDYLAAAEIAQHFQGLVIGFPSAGNVRRGRPFFADTLLSTFIGAPYFIYLLRKQSR
ncbi:hypothetical protein DD587_13290, partial [Klebsiella pneumoniae]